MVHMPYMFHVLPTVCIVFCVTANYIQINSINILNLVGFLVRAKYVLRNIEIKCLYVIYLRVGVSTLSW
jgi:hypothetical protein